MAYPPDSPDEASAHQIVAEHLAHKLGWDTTSSKRVHRGRLPDGSYVFVFDVTEPPEPA